MLACICPDGTSCRGHISARMVHDNQPKYENLFHASPEDESLSIDGGDVVFFKGENVHCPIITTVMTAAQWIFLQWQMMTTMMISIHTTLITTNQS